MSAMFAPLIWQPDDYILFRKCGEITISPDMQNIGFNCMFCTGICLESEIFLQHLQEQHREDIFKLYEAPEQPQQNGILSGEFVKVDIEELNLQEILLQPNLNFNNLNCNNDNDIESEEYNENVRPHLNMLTPSSSLSEEAAEDLNFVYDLANNDLLTLTSNYELANPITINPLENLCNAQFNSPNYSTNTSFFTPSSTPSSSPSSTISSSSNCIKCLTADNECEIGDGEDSGIMLAQSPCNSSACGGFSDCMSFTEDSSSKSMNNLTDNRESPTAEFLKQQTESETCTSEEICLDLIKSTVTKGKYIKTPAMRKVLNNKDIISYLLEAYKKNEKLWNPKHPSYKYNARRSVYNELSKPLMQDMKFNLTGNEIFGIINELRGRYRRELSKFQKRKGKHKTRLWYFNKMEFLRKIIEEKRKERLKEKDGQTNDLTDRQVLSYLLTLYKNYECLWNNSKDLDMEIVTKIYEEISQELQKKLNILITPKDCLNEIQKLRIRYRKELRIMHKLKGLYLPKLWCFDEMDFLRPEMEDKIRKFLKKNSCHSPNHLSQGKHDFLKAEQIQFQDLEQQLQFIEIYRNYTTLWDVDHPDFRSTNYRNKALNEMLEEYNLTFVQNKVQLEQLEKTLHQMRKDFSMEKQKRLANNNITDDNENGLSLEVYSKLAEFLTINLGPFRCDNCQLMCKTYDQYKIHKSKHDGTLPFICTLCGKGFQIPGNLTIHIRRHRRDFPYSCEICKKSFATSTEVNIHMRSHTGERPYICDFCGKTFKTWSFFDIHKRTHLNQSNFHCPICDKSFYERNRFTDHMNIHLNIRKHQCEKCGKGFTTYGNLKKHLELHAATKKYKCQPCGRSFAQFASLRWHRKTQHEQ